MTYAAIPTIYKSIRFRSRLEAKWAAFFDLLKWRYEYEPYDLDGWIPDFIIMGEKEILVEVKPFTEKESFDIGKLFKAARGTEKETKEIILLGTSVFPANYWHNAACIGWLNDAILADNFDEAIFNHWNGIYGFIHSSGGWQDRITGLYDGNGFLDIPQFSEIQEIWNEAGSIVQWKR
jgi:hypothetical protein